MCIVQKEVFKACIFWNSLLNFNLAILVFNWGVEHLLTFSTTQLLKVIYLIDDKNQILPSYIMYHLILSLVPLKSERHPVE